MASCYRLRNTDLETVKEDLTKIEEQVTSLLKEIADALPTGTVSLDVKRAPQILHEGVSVSLVPGNPVAATIVADARNGFSIVSLVLGKSTPVEVLPGGRRAQLDEIRTICQAVIEGKFQEDITFVGTEITKCVGKLDIDGHEQVFRYFGRVFPLKKKQQIHVSYSAY